MAIVMFTEQGVRKTIEDGGARHEGSQGIGLSAGINVYDGGDIAVMTAVKLDGSFARSWQGIPVQDIPAVVDQLTAIHRQSVQVQKNDAKQQLIEALVADKEGQFSEWSEVSNLLKNGFQGFGNMPVAELIQCAKDADLNNRNPTVAALVATLEGNQQM